MIYTQFGRTDLRTSVIGLGTWGLGGPNTVNGVATGWTPIPEEQAASTIQAALDAGINFFDTSDFYGRGVSEELLGKYLPRSRTDVIIATKVGILPRMVPDNPTKLDRDFSAAYIRQGVEASLRRLQRDCIDLYQLHGPDGATLRSEETLSALEKLKNEGKVRYVGVSLSTKRTKPEDLDYTFAHPLFDSIQTKYNVTRVDFSDSLERFAQYNKAVLARTILQHGLLLGKYRDNGRFDKVDHRRLRLNETWLDKVDFFQEQLRSKLPHRAETPTEVPILWVIGDPQVTVVLCGATRPEQIKENVALLERPPLTPGERQTVKQIAADAFRQKVNTV